MENKLYQLNSMYKNRRRCSDRQGLCLIVSRLTRHTILAHIYQNSGKSQLQHLIRHTKETHNFLPTKQKADNTVQITGIINPLKHSGDYRVYLSWFPQAVYAISLPWSMTRLKEHAIYGLEALILTALHSVHTVKVRATS